MLTDYAKQRTLQHFNNGYKAPTIAKLCRQEGILVSRKNVWRFLCFYMTSGYTGYYAHIMTVNLVRNKYVQICNCGIHFPFNRVLVYEVMSLCTQLILYHTLFSRLYNRGKKSDSQSSKSLPYQLYADISFTNVVIVICCLNSVGNYSN